MKEASGAKEPGASDLQERDLPLVTGWLEPAQEGAQPRDARQSREHGRGQASAAAGDTGAISMLRSDPGLAYDLQCFPAGRRAGLGRSITTPPA